MYKATVALFATIAVAAAFVVPNAHVGVHHESSVGVKDVALKQKLVLQLLKNIGQKNLYPELVALGKSWNPEQYIDHYANQYVVKNFVSLWKQGTLPRGEIFHLYNDVHLKEVVAFFDLLYFAKDFDTFIKTAAWARDNFNEGQFVYGLYVAVVHRADMAGVVLPPLYEVYPHFYFQSTDLSDFQSAKMQGLFQFVKTTNFTSGDYILHPEQLLGYFTEDIGLNAYHAYAHLYMPFWMNCEKYGITTCQFRGEAFYYFYQQLLAHYNLHRMANYLPEMEDFDWEKPVKYGFNPDLKYMNGAYFPSRPAEYELFSIKSYSVEDVKAFEYRIKQAIDSGFVEGKDGNKISITHYLKGINILGNIIEGNQDSVNSRYYGSYTTMLRNLFALIMDPGMEHGVAPGVMAHYETALRDPAFYYYTQYILDFFQQYKNNLPYYHTEDLYFNGVAVKDVAVDQLVTYFDHFDVDVTNAVEFGASEDTSKYYYIAKSLRLNHQPFSYKVKVASDKTVSAVVRVFLGPSTEYIYSNFYGDQASDAYYGHDTYDLDRLRHFFVELDRFPVDLKTGENFFERQSREFTSTVGDYQSFKSLLKSAESGHAYVPSADFHCGFPDRLALPIGNKAGVPYTFFVMVTPYGSSEEHSDYYHNQLTHSIFSCNGLNTVVDNRPLGFPFDRKIENFKRFYTPNMYFKDVFVFHKDTTSVHDHTQNVVFEKTINNFDSVISKSGHKYTAPSENYYGDYTHHGEEYIHSF